VSARGIAVSLWLASSCGAAGPQPRAAACSPAGTSIVYANRMSATFQLERLSAAIDRAPVYERSDDGSHVLAAQRQVALFAGALSPGNHEVAVDLTYRGHGYGVFAYLDRYTFRVRSSHVLAVDPAHATQVDAIGDEADSPAAPLDQRPRIDWRVASLAACSARPP
jgi:hypothetical protein